MSGQLKIFLSYSHRDKEQKDLFLTHFSSIARTENVSIWTDVQIDAGTQWDEVISGQLCSADIVILLVSANFIASEYIYNKELAKALELQEANKVWIIPVMLSNCSVTDMKLSAIQTLPTDPRFVEAWTNQNDAWVNVVEGIRKSIKKIIEHLQVWDPVSAMESIKDLLKQSQKLEEACNKTIDFAVNYGHSDQEFEAVILRTKLSDLEQATEKSSGGANTPPLVEILNAKQALRMEIYKLIKSIMAEVSKEVSEKSSGKRA